MNVIPFSPNIFNIFNRFDRDFICLFKLNRFYIFQFLQDPFEKIPEIYKQEIPRLAVTRFSATLKKMNGSMVFDDGSDLEEVPNEVCVMHVVHAFKLAVELREKDQGSRRSMLSQGVNYIIWGVREPFKLSFTGQLNFQKLRFHALLYFQVLSKLFPMIYILFKYFSFDILHELKYTTEMRHFPDQNIRKINLHITRKIMSMKG